MAGPWEYMPGVPAAGHVTSGGHWHPGPISTCRKGNCNPEPSITCPQCGMTSYNPNDIRERYCGNCHQYHDQM